MKEICLDKARSQVAHILSSMAQTRPCDEKTRSEWLKILSQWECWEPCMTLLEQSSDQKTSEHVEQIIMKIKILNICLHRTDDAIKSCCMLTKKFCLHFEDILTLVFPKILSPGDTLQRIKFCNALAHSFAEISDKILCLEHIAFLYDKKIHNETALSEAYQNILKLDSKNIRALKFFKSINSQLHNWEETIRYLKMLLSSVQYPEEKFRIAQELAVVSLYQLNKPEQALYFLNSYCEKSPLDTTTLKYDAYSALMDWKNCLKILLESLNKTKDVKEKSIICFKIGQIFTKIQEDANALTYFRKSSEYWPEILEPIEEEILIYMRRKEWHNLSESLLVLQDKLTNDENRKKIDDLHHMVLYGIQHEND